VILYLVLGVLLVGAILPSLANPDSAVRPLRFVFVFAVYPVFFAISVLEGLEAAAVLWIALAGLALMLELVADTLLPEKHRQSLLTAVWRAALLWPLVMPAAIEALLVRLGLAPGPLEARLPEPPSGAELFALPDDELLVAAHQLLGRQANLSQEERTVWVGETFSREVHGGGLLQWFSNTDSSVPETAQALRDVGAPVSAETLELASDAVSNTWNHGQPLEAREQSLKSVAPALRSLDARLFSPQQGEDLTALIARYIRQNRSRCPALEVRG
jgi:hypothetical protein